MCLPSSPFLRLAFQTFSEDDDSGGEEGKEERHKKASLLLPPFPPPPPPPHRSDTFSPPPSPPTLITFPGPQFSHTEEGLLTSTLQAGEQWDINVSSLSVEPVAGDQDRGGAVSVTAAAGVAAESTSVVPVMPLLLCVQQLFMRLAAQDQEEEEAALMSRSCASHAAYVDFFSVKKIPENSEGRLTTLFGSGKESRRDRRLFVRLSSFRGGREGE